MIEPQDIWHCFHGGLGKQFLSSAVAELIPCLVQGSSLDTRLEVVHQAYLQWKSLPGGMRLHYRKLDRETFGLTSLQVQPKGAWTKFNDTRILFKFFQYFLEKFPKQICGHSDHKEDPGGTCACQSGFWDFVSRWCLAFA